MADAQVTLNADTGEKKDAPMQVAVKLKTHPPACQLSKGPVVSTGIVVDQQREGAHIQQVSCSQVQRVDLGTSQEMSGSPQVKDDSAVEWQAENEDHAVHHREEDAFKILTVGAGRET